MRRKSLPYLLVSTLCILAAVCATTGAQEPTPAPPAGGTRERVEPPPGPQTPPAKPDAPPADEPAGPPVRNIQLPPPPVDPNEFKLSSDVELVLLDVSVKDGNGGFASGLKKEQFKVYEDGKEQEIRVFAAADIPVTVGLVVDNSASMRPKRPDVVTAALTLVQQSNPQDEVFVVNFNERVSFGLPKDTPFTDDRQLLRQALLGNPVQGRTAVNDALKVALEHLNKGRRDKKTLVLISDGGDNASANTAADIYRLAEESTATIYTIGIYDPEDKDKNPGFLRKLANVTGGEVFLPERLTDLVPVCEKIAKDIRNRYTIGFVPSLTGNPVRKLRVVASAPDRGKLTVRTRTFFIASRNDPGKPARKKR